jgi:hypothetical protein
MPIDARLGQALVGQQLIVVRVLEVLGELRVGEGHRAVEGAGAADRRGRAHHEMVRSRLLAAGWPDRGFSPVLGEDGTMRIGIGEGLDAQIAGRWRR